MEDEQSIPGQACFNLFCLGTQKNKTVIPQHPRGISRENIVPSKEKC